MNVRLTEEWCEDDGDCLFFHFDDFASAPTVMCGSPNDSIFDEEFWTHFIVIDFNEVFDQAK